MGTGAGDPASARTCRRPGPESSSRAVCTKVNPTSCPQRGQGPVTVLTPIPACSARSWRSIPETNASYASCLHRSSAEQARSHDSFFFGFIRPPAAHSKGCWRRDAPAAWHPKHAPANPARLTVDGGIRLMVMLPAGQMRHLASAHTGRPEMASSAPFIQLSDFVDAIGLLRSLARRTGQRPLAAPLRRWPATSSGARSHFPAPGPKHGFATPR